MSWITLSADDVKKTMSTAEVTKVETLVPANTLSEALLGVIREVRGYVRKQTTPGDGNTIPETLKKATLSIARYSFLASVPSGGLITEQRQREYDDAQKLLKAVGTGDFVLEEATTPSSETVNIPGPSVTGKTLEYTRSDQDGI